MHELPQHALINVLRGFPEGYPVDIATYFVSKEHQENHIEDKKEKMCDSNT